MLTVQKIGDEDLRASLQGGAGELRPNQFERSTRRVDATRLVLDEGQVQQRGAVFRLRIESGLQQTFRSIELFGAVGDDGVENQEARVFRKAQARILREQAGLLEFARGEVAADQPMRDFGVGVVAVGPRELRQCRGDRLVGCDESASMER